MQKTLLVAGLLLVLTVAFAFTRHDRPEFDHTAYQRVGNPVTLNFRVHKFNAHGVELALSNPGLPTFFIQFEVGMDGITMAGISNGSELKGTAAPRNLPNDFLFLRDKEGDPVLDLTFTNELMYAEGISETPIMLEMKYTGMPVGQLIRTLHIKDDFTLPSSLSRQFGVEGPIQFQQADLYLDGNAVWIPVRIDDGKER